VNLYKLYCGLCLKRLDVVRL